MGQGQRGLELPNSTGGAWNFMPRRIRRLPTKQNSTGNYRDVPTGYNEHAHKMKAASQGKAAIKLQCTPMAWTCMLHPCPLSMLGCSSRVPCMGRYRGAAHG